MAKGHRSQIKRERNQQTDFRPRAKVSFARVSPTKADIVLKTIRGKDVAQAIGILAYTPRNGARIIEKVLKSAVANADHRNMMDPEHAVDLSKLYVSECYAGKGPTMKRIKPRAQGRAFRIEKKTSHITIILDER